MKLARYGMVLSNYANWFVQSEQIHFLANITVFLCMQPFFRF